VSAPNSRRPMKLAFISDIHEDYRSLQTAFKLIEKTNCDQVVCLGDIVGFSFQFQQSLGRRNADACLEMVKDQCRAVVAGNHDLFAAGRLPAYAAGFEYPEGWHDLGHEQRVRLSRNRVWIYDDMDRRAVRSPASMDFLLSLPEFLIVEHPGQKFLFSHFNYPDFSGSTTGAPRKPKDLADHFEFMDRTNCGISISGHGHPEGVLSGDRRSIRLRPFGSYCLKQEAQWLVCPCIANSSRPSGFMAFDTETRLLDIMPLNEMKRQALL